MDERGPDRLTALLGRLEAPPTPPDLRGRVMSAVRSRARRPAFRLAWSLASVAAVALLSLRLTGEPEPRLLHVGSADLGTDALLVQHSWMAAGDGLGDGAAWHAVGALASRGLSDAEHR